MTNYPILQFFKYDHLPPRLADVSLTGWFGRRYLGTSPRFVARFYAVALLLLLALQGCAVVDSDPADAFDLRSAPPSEPDEEHDEHDEHDECPDGVLPTVGVVEPGPGDIIAGDLVEVAAAVPGGQRLHVYAAGHLNVIALRPGDDGLTRGVIDVSHVAPGPLDLLVSTVDIKTGWRLPCSRPVTVRVEVTR